MPLHRSCLRCLALLCLLCPSVYCFATKPSAAAGSANTGASTAGSSIVGDSGNVTCRYRLEGLQNESTKATLPEAHYSSLPPGKYTVHVTCDSPQQGQAISGADTFTVIAPWWQQWLTEIAGTCGVVLLLWGILWKRHHDRRENERLEEAVAERSAALAQANRELQEASLSDPLTGIRNRRFFNSMITADASQAIRAARSAQNYSRDHRDLIFFLVDIDHFKAVNDEFGHDAGDRMLVEIAKRLTSVVRESDFLIRWGGEEFLVVCRSAEPSDALFLATRILKAVNSKEYDLGGERRLTRSCSVGWAAFPWLPPAFSDLPVDEVLRLADRGLYLAKQHGRDQAVGLVPTTNTPVRPGKYLRLEQLLEDKLVREVRTPGRPVVASAAAGSA
jgi:diguanylate cyclase (GGDEF)-like protein